MPWINLTPRGAQNIHADNAADLMMEKRSEVSQVFDHDDELLKDIVTHC